MPKPPKGEIPWLSVYDGRRELRYIITSLPDRSVYKLYTPDGDGWRLRGKHASAGVLAQRADAMGL